MSGDTQHLAQMANDIGNFFRAQSNHEDAVAGIANHIASFWTRRMQDKLIAHAEHDDAGLDALPLEAVRRLAAQAREKPMRPGDDVR